MSGWWALLYAGGLLIGLGAVGLLGAAGIQAALGLLSSGRPARKSAPRPALGRAAASLHRKMKALGPADPAAPANGSAGLLEVRWRAGPGRPSRQLANVQGDAPLPQAGDYDVDGFHRPARSQRGKSSRRSGLAAGSGTSVLLRRTLDGSGPACRGARWPEVADRGSSPSKGFPLVERRIAMTPATSYPDLEWLVDDLSELDIDSDALDRLATFRALICRRRSIASAVAPRRSRA